MKLHKHLEVDGLKDLIRRVQLQEQHDEDPMVRHLVFQLLYNFSPNTDYFVQMSQERFILRN